MEPENKPNISVPRYCRKETWKTPSAVISCDILSCKTVKTHFPCTPPLNLENKATELRAWCHGQEDGVVQASDRHPFVFPKRTPARNQHLSRSRGVA